MMTLQSRRSDNRQARIGIIGLGYVGLPLAVEFAHAGFDVTGFDVDAAKVAAINAGRSYIGDVAQRRTSPPAWQAGQAAATDRHVAARTTWTPSTSACRRRCARRKDPDLSYVVSAVEAVRARTSSRGSSIILESTTYPGTTDEVVQPMLEAKGLKAGKDFYLAFSPERVDPGNADVHDEEHPEGRRRHRRRQHGGWRRRCTARSIDTVVPVSSTQVAEMVKLLENTFRAVNIGLVNEIALMCHRMDIDVWEVIDAAKHQAVRLHAVLSRARASAATASRSIRSTCRGRRGRTASSAASSSSPATSTASMPELCRPARQRGAQHASKKSINGSRIHVFGIAYKKDVSDMRESPALDIIELLQRRGAMLSYTDPYVPKLRSRRSVAEVGARGAGGERDRLRGDLHRSTRCSTTRRSPRAFRWSSIRATR